MNPENDYERGQNAFTDGDAHLYNSGSEEFKEGYKDAHNAHIPDHEGFYSETAWDQHYFDEIKGSTTFDQSAAFSEIHEDIAKRLHAKQFAMNVVMLTVGVLIGAGAVLAGSVTR